MFENIMAVVNPGGVAKRAEARLKIAETNMKIDAVKMKHTMLKIVQVKHTNSPLMRIKLLLKV